MALQKSQLYSSIWKSCDELRGGMDTSEYKDYILVLLFIKYISDKYAGMQNAPITVPEGSTFKDMVALKDKMTIGEDINKKILAPIVEANNFSEMPDFNSSEKFGYGREMVHKLSNLITIFENPALDEEYTTIVNLFDYLIKQFSLKSVKSNAQFYTPIEISSVISKIIDISKSSLSTPTVYDPTCGTGSLLLKVANETDKKVKLYGQEIDNTIARIARMNMILHNNPTAVIERENTLSTPLFIENNQLKTFDFVVANPPFSNRTWRYGFNPERDVFNRFQSFGIPPSNNGDYAFLLHIISSLKSTGKGICILPQGALFRSNSEATIRKNIIQRGIIKGIIGLPANLFYGVSIPTCIIVLDKEFSENRKSIFMINASNKFEKDKNNNYLGIKNINEIVDVFNKQKEIPTFSRMVSVEEIEKNKYNLSIPRYIESQTIQTINVLQTNYKSYSERILDDVVIEINTTDTIFNDIANSLYISKYGRHSPFSNLSDINSPQKNYFQVILEQNIVKAKYLEIFFKSKLGKLILDTQKNYTVVPRIDRLTLLETKIFIPDIKTQEMIIQTSLSIDKLEKEIENFESQLSLNPNSASKIQDTLTNALHALGKLNEEDQILDLIKQGESKTLEFKQTFTKDIDTNLKEKERSIRETSLKNIVAFLNSDGGTLLIGVKDTGEIFGIENDNFDTIDKYLLNFKNCIKEQIGEEAYPFIDWDIVSVLNKKVLKIDCKRSTKKPFFLNKQDFYVRTNPSADKLMGDKLLEYINERFDR